MKLLGDVSENDKKLAKALLEAEEEADLHPTLPNDVKAQVYTLLAHDWYDIEVEEEGNRLLLKADDIFPGYFKDKIAEHMKKDPIFAFTVQNMTTMIFKIMGAGP